MRKYSSLTWKRTWVWSNTKHISCLDLGPLTPDEKQSSSQTTTRYRDKRGKTRFKGNTLLKSSQSLCLELDLYFMLLVWTRLEIVKIKHFHPLKCFQQTFPQICPFPYIGNILTSSLGNCFEWYHSYVQKGFKTIYLWRHWMPNAGFIFETLNDSNMVFISFILACPVRCHQVLLWICLGEWSGMTSHGSGRMRLISER